ncbi:hypothetical protein TNIN_258801 [Trichonephila inaurata madagascariensis]|uniref:Uncharacterized protein n=1 Tax=Trichonephila inaurata madagascariensis TaxID=2747483 RepID=A0A8X6MMD0_9ARAC|nr:hypothetical protein TNIN_258801 [Trichonephila inaurata madagascariensis]
MSRGLEAEFCPASGYFQWSGGRTLSCVRVCPVSGGRTLSSVRGMSSVQVEEFCLASEVAVSSGETSIVRGMSSGRLAELCPASEACPVAVWLNSVLRQGHVQGRLAELSSASEACQLASPELCPVPGALAVTGWQNSALLQLHVRWPRGITLSSVRGMSSGWVADV